MFAKFVRLASIPVLLGIATVPATAQVIVTGIVRGESTEPLSGAAVQIRGLHAGMLTGADGRYRIEIPRALADSADSVTIDARRIGFMPVSQRVASRGAGSVVDFVLKPALLSLASVVVTGAAGATDPGAPGIAKERGKAMVAPVPASSPAAKSEVRDARATAADRVSTKTRADGSRVRRGGVAVPQEPSPGVLTAAVWDDAAHWRDYERFLGRASENSWNPWGLDVGQSTIRPVRATSRTRSERRALDLGFLVDATGSMGDEMTFLKSELKDIVRRVRAVEPDLDIRLSVVFYRDLGDAFVTKQLAFTRNAEEAVSFIAGTTADGGGDYPEDMNAGLEGMMHQQWSTDAIPQMVFLLADAPPHQYPGEDYTYHEAIRDAAAKGIAIYPVAASGVDKPTEFLFRAMAVMTGGKYIFLTDDSGVGDSHEQPDITGYTVEKLNDLMVREIRTYVATHTGTRKVAENR